MRSKVQHFTLLRISFFFPVEFQILARVYQPVEICQPHQQFQRFNVISMWLEAKL